VSLGVRRATISRALLPRPDLISGAVLAGSACSKHLSWVRRRRRSGRRRRAREGARRPGNDFRPHPAYQYVGFGSRGTHPVDCRARVGGRQAKKRWRNRGTVRHRQPVQSMRKGCQACGGGQGRDVLEGTLTSVDLRVAGRGPCGLQLDGCGARRRHRIGLNGRRSARGRTPRFA